MYTPEPLATARFVASAEQPVAIGSLPSQFVVLGEVTQAEAPKAFRSGIPSAKAIAIATKAKQRPSIFFMEAPLNSGLSESAYRGWCVRPLLLMCVRPAMRDNSSGEIQA